MRLDSLQITCLCILTSAPSSVLGFSPVTLRAQASLASLSKARDVSLAGTTEDAGLSDLMDVIPPVRLMDVVDVIPSSPAEAVQIVVNTVVETVTDSVVEGFLNLAVDYLPPDVVRWFSSPDVINGLTTIAIFTAVVALVASWIYLTSPLDLTESPYSSNTTTNSSLIYDAKRSEEYYAKRLGLVIKRLIPIVLFSFAFVMGLLWDWLVLGKVLGDEEFQALQKAEPQRAQEAKKICHDLGPTFASLGQLLSLRTDWLPANYVAELQCLQVGVAPPSSLNDDDSMATGVVLLNNKTSNGELSVSDDTAIDTDMVEVSRSSLVAERCLDLYLVRQLLPLPIKAINLVNGVETEPQEVSGALAWIDDCSVLLLKEFDYRSQIETLHQFETITLKFQIDSFDIPKVAPTNQSMIVTTNWRTLGSPIGNTTSSDVPRLCSVALQVYLTMLLEFGSVPADPVENILRTPAGKVAMRNWGRTFHLSEQEQQSWKRILSHTMGEDCHSIVNTLKVLGLVAHNQTIEEVRESNTVSNLLSGFQPSQLHLNGLRFLQNIHCESNQSSLALPPYLVHLVRVADQLECAAQAVDAEYSIVNHSFYAAKIQPTQRPLRLSGFRHGMRMRFRRIKQTVSALWKRAN